MATRALVDAHRRDLDGLVGIAERDLGLFFRQFDTVEAARDALRDLLPQLVGIYGEAAATLGADWYDELRDSAGAGGRFTAIPAELPDRGRTDALARWAAGEARSLETMLPLVVGGVQRIISDADRGSVIRSSLQDRATAGWQRMGAGGCSFCLMLISRGAVYSEATADFASHDNCHCQAVPIFRGAEPIDVKDYVRSARNISDADRARVREYLRTH